MPLPHGSWLKASHSLTLIYCRDLIKQLRIDLSGGVCQIKSSFSCHFNKKVSLLPYFHKLNWIVSVCIYCGLVFCGRMHFETKAHKFTCLNASFSTCCRYLGSHYCQWIPTHYSQWSLNSDGIALKIVIKLLTKSSSQMHMHFSFGFVGLFNASVSNVNTNKQTN